ncbi:MAG: alkaline phosphatase family protein [Deltaproteobacteria bacterium]
MRRAVLAFSFTALAACGHPAAPPQNVIQIEIDDHGLQGLWNANAPNLKALIARGVFGFSRVQIPTHSNQGNYATLTAQFPEGDDVAGNARLDRPKLDAAVSFQSLGLGAYALYPENPLRTRGDSVYQAAHRLGIHPSYLGQLPPFELGADDVHFTIGGSTLYGIPVSWDLGKTLLETLLDYPSSLVEGGSYHLDGPGYPGETTAHFTFRDAANLIAASTPENPIPRYMYLWNFPAVDNDPTSVFGAEGVGVIEDYDDAIGDIIQALDSKGLLAQTNIVFTLDHGKTNTLNQAVLGAHPSSSTDTTPADGQLAALVTEMGPALGISTSSYFILQDDGDCPIFANVPNAGTAAGTAEQERVTHALLQVVQSGKLLGVDPTRTITFDGAMGTRRFQDYRIAGPHQADLLVFSSPNWTLNQVDGKNAQPGPFQDHTQYPYGRHGGLSEEELYVPFIFAGPAFKQGVMLPHPIQQADVAATAMWALGAGYLTTQEGAPVMAAFAGQPGEAIAQPNDMTTAQPTILAGEGWDGKPSVAPAQSAVIIDVAGLYYDEIFTDTTPSLRAAAQPFLDLMERATVFDHFWNRYRDWPVDEYEMLVGGYPVSLDWIPHAEDDPTQEAAPALGFLAMPVPSGFVSDPAGMTAWRQSQSFGVQSIFDAAKAQGLQTAFLGQPDYHELHIDQSQIDLNAQVDPSSLPAELNAFLKGHPRSLTVVALGAPRTADRHSAAAAAELASLAETVRGLVSAASGSLILITSRGGTAIDDPGADFYGPTSSRHVPLIALGPNVRANVVTSEPGQMSDIPATALVGLGFKTSTDFVDGTWATGTPVGGIPQPTPAGATAGHALMRAYLP